MKKATRDIEQETSLALGRVVMRFAALEAIFRHVLVSVLDEIEDPQDVQALISELSFRRLRGALSALYARRFPDSAFQKSLKEINKRAQRLEDRRNALIHSAWEYTNLPDAMVRQKGRVTGSGAYRTDQEIISEEAQLRTFVREIDDLISELAHRWIIDHLGVSVPRERVEYKDWWGGGQ